MEKIKYSFTVKDGKFKGQNMTIIQKDDLTYIITLGGTQIQHLVESIDIHISVDNPPKINMVLYDDE